MIERVDLEGFAGLRLAHARDPGGLSATYAPGAGMLGVSLRDGDDELLGQRRGIAAYAHDGRTMGIPLLHPWANRLAGDAYRVGDVEVRLGPGTPRVRRDANGLPIHGVVAGTPHWRLEPQAAAGEVARLVATLDYGAHPELTAAFPFRHRLRMEVTLAERTLTVRTTLTATGDRPVPVAYGFHPYLQLPAAARADWRVELPNRRQLALDARGIPTGARESRQATALALADRALDDAFDGIAAGATFAVEGGGRRLEVRFEQGFPAAQVYAPRGEDVVCFEPMTAPVNALISGDGLRLVAPGAQDVTAFSIAVREAPA